MMYFFKISSISFRNFLIFRRNYHDKSENNGSIKKKIYKVSILKFARFLNFWLFSKNPGLR